MAGIGLAEEVQEAAGDLSPARDGLLWLGVHGMGHLVRLLGRRLVPCFASLWMMIIMIACFWPKTKPQFLMLRPGTMTICRQVEAACAQPTSIPLLVKDDEDEA